METKLQKRKLDICICAKNRVPIIQIILENLDKLIKDIDCNIILVDGRSEDQTPQVMVDYKEKHKDNCIVAQINKEESYIEAYNKAMSLTVSDYVCWLDSDDLCDENRFSEEIKFLDEHKDVDIVSCITFLGDSNALTNTLIDFDHEKLSQAVSNNVPMRELCHFQSCMFRRSCLKVFKNNIYFYPEYIGGFAGEGFLYTMYFKNKKFANISSTHYIYNIGMLPGSLSNTIVPLFANGINELDLDGKKKEITKLLRKYNKAEK